MIEAHDTYVCQICGHRTPQMCMACSLHLCGAAKWCKIAWNSNGWVWIVAVGGSI